jgi:DNA-binding protein HU-beta
LSSKESDGFKYKNRQIGKQMMIVSFCELISIEKIWEEVNVMNKTDLINAVAEKSDLSKKDATKAVDAVFESVMDSLKDGEKVQLIGFGNFEVRERSARKGRNPQTGEEIEIPASKVPAFKPGKALKDSVK